MPRAARNSCLVLAAVLFGVAIPGAPAATQEVAELDDLEEVVVHGKQLSQQIVDAEDEYFSLFNDVNKDDRYDTHCVYLQLDAGSRIQNRACMPGFVADAMADWAPYKARCQPPLEGADEFSCLDRNKDSRLTRDEAAARDELVGGFDSLDRDRGADGFLNREEFFATCGDCSTDFLPSSATAIYMPPTPDLVLAEGSKRWYEHMLKVTSSDPRLKEMADHLGDLYYELAATQRQYDKLEAEARPRKVDLSKAGPRAR